MVNTVIKALASLALLIPVALSHREPLRQSRMVYSCWIPPWVYVTTRFDSNGLSYVSFESGHNRVYFNLR